MYEVETTMQELNKYLKKLELLILNGGEFTFLHTKLVKKNSIDDLLCCIEASIPDEYKEYVKKKSTKKMESELLYAALKSFIQNKFMFSSSLYSVQYKRAAKIITDYQRALNSDLKYIQRGH
jgi:hypothetical protein